MSVKVDTWEVEKCRLISQNTKMMLQKTQLSDDDLQKNEGVGVFSLCISKDGYMRLSPVQFKSLVLQHLISGLDDESEPPVVEGVGASSISGYTEWETKTSPPITIGWDWHVRIAQGKGDYVRSGHPRSNVMLIDEIQRHDLGPTSTENLLSQLIDTMDWEKTVQQYIKNRYL